MYTRPGVAHLDDPLAGGDEYVWVGDRGLYDRLTCQRDVMAMTNRSPEVDAWMESYHNPLKPLVQAVRAVILDADPR